MNYHLPTGLGGAGTTGAATDAGHALLDDLLHAIKVSEAPTKKTNLEN